jgi:hypothetical protein
MIPYVLPYVLLEHSGNHVVRQLMPTLFNRIALLRVASMAEAAATHVRRASETAARVVLEQREPSLPGPQPAKGSIA